MSPDPRRIRRLKFGGTSVADARRMEALVDLVASEAADVRPVVVVSAMGGVTQSLWDASDAAARGDAAWREILEEMVVRFREPLETLVTEVDRAAVMAAFEGWIGDLRDLLHGVSLVRECTPRTRDSILCLGELTSATLVASAFRRAGRDAAACDARALVRTDAIFGGASVDMEATGERVRAYFAEHGGIQVVTGFIAATAEGETTTLGRGGSDYTAALLGALLDADRVEIWTDVDGVMSADPRLVPGAFSLPAMTYEELLELSHFGAKVVYPPAVHPARQRGVPLLIRNTMNPAFPGTWVRPGEGGGGSGPVRGISSIREVALLRLEGDGMVGVPGTAERLFRALARYGISVILISQASSEHSICFAVQPGDVAVARRAIDDEFRLERGAGLVDDVVVEADVSVVAAVGEGMREQPGVAGRLFSVLGRRGINVRAIAQGSSELNISLVVGRGDVEPAVRVLHEAFFAPRGRPVRVYLAGVGSVGGELIRQMAAVRNAWKDDLGIDLQLAGVANSKRSAWADGGLPWDGWPDALGASTSWPGALVEAAADDPAALRVFVDCTADDLLPGSYGLLLGGGVPVVAANKKGFAGPQASYAGLRRGSRARSYLEATVGAGLPILRAVEDLRDTGDRIVDAEGALSGTLAYLFSELMAGTPFSEALAAARELGYTEPDPREDLSGQDVLRKLVILSREAGWALEPEDVSVHPVLPGSGWDDLDVDGFLARLPEVDPHFEALRDDARARDARLCFLGSAREGHASVSVQVLGPGHPFHALRGTDSMVALRTERYDSPLVIRGAGAGREVTAAGVLSDIRRCLVDQLTRVDG